MGAQGLGDGLRLGSRLTTGTGVLEGRGVGLGEAVATGVGEGLGLALWPGVTGIDVPEGLGEPGTGLPVEVLTLVPLLLVPVVATLVRGPPGTAEPPVAGAVTWGF